MKIRTLILATIISTMSAIPVYASTSNAPNLEQKSASAGRYLTDSKVTLAVKSKLLANKSIKSTEISVTTTNGVVKLTGTVETNAQKSEVEKIVKSVSGVKSVKNSLQVIGENAGKSNSSNY